MTTMIRIRMLALTASAVVITTTGVLVGSAAAAPASPPHTVIASLAGGAFGRDTVQLEQGTDEYVVDESFNSGFYGFLEVHTATGPARTLLVDPKSHDDDDEPGNFSVVGDTLTDDQGDIWNLATTARSYASYFNFPSGGADYAGAAPAGVLGVGVNSPHTIEIATPDGSGTPLGSAFPGDSTANVPSVSPGVNGFIVGNSVTEPNTLMYQTWADPGHFTALPAMAQTCPVVGATVAACINYGKSVVSATPTVTPTGITIVPLDGSTPHTVSTCFAPTTTDADYSFPQPLKIGVAAGASSITWLDCHHDLESLSTTGKVAKSSGAGNGKVNGLVGGFGHNLTETTPDTAVDQASGLTLTTHVQFQARNKTQTVTNFSLTNDRVAWAGSGAHADTESVTSRTVELSKNALSVAHPHVLASKPIPNGNDVAAHAGSTAYVTHSHDHGVDSDLNITADGHSTVIARHIRALPVPQLSAKYVLGYRNIVAHKTIRAVVYGVASHHLIAKGPAFSTNGGARPAALSGNEFVYADSRGVIHREDLATKKTTTVFDPSYPTTQVVVAVSVYAASSWVAWTERGEDPGPGANRHTDSAYRNVVANGALQTLPVGDVVVELSGDGVIYSNQTAFDHGDTKSFVYSLRPYGGNARAILTTNAPVLQGPQVDDGIMAWIDEQNVLRAAPVPAG